MGKGVRISPPRISVLEDRLAQLVTMHDMENMTIEVVPSPLVVIRHRYMRAGKVCQWEKLFYRSTVSGHG